MKAEVVQRTDSTIARQRNNKHVSASKNKHVTVVEYLKEFFFYSDYARQIDRRSQLMESFEGSQSRQTVKCGRESRGTRSQ
jgi:hypothetical protein